MFDIVKIVLILVIVFLAMGVINVLIDYILYRNKDVNCDFGYDYNCEHCKIIDGCLIGFKKNLYSKRWRDG